MPSQCPPPSSSPAIVFQPRADQRRTNTFDLQQVTCVDILALEESVKTFDWEKLSNIIPLILRYALDINCR